MHTTSTAYAEPEVRTVRLHAALAVGAAVVAGAFGAGYVLAQALDEPVAATAAVQRAAVGHTFGSALTESLALKQRPLARDKSSDVRYRRIR